MAVIESKSLVTKIDDHAITRVPVGELHAAVGREPAVVGHLGKADALPHGMDALVASEHLSFVEVPQLAVDMPHRHRAIEHVEQLLFPSELGALKVCVAPDPRAAD